MAKVIQLHRPKTYTTSERLIERLREEIFRDGRSYRIIADKVGVSGSTVGNLASGKTRWPRPTTLFPLLEALRLEMQLVRK